MVVRGVHLFRKEPAIHQSQAQRTVEVRETHTAVVFFFGDRGYKLKKPLDLGFVDFSTADARKEVCEREIALNRRFAPDVYLGVAHLHSPCGGPPEPMVVMRRMPDDRRLSRLVTAKVAVDDVLRDVARLVATWHANAARRPEVDQQGSRDALLGRWEASFDQVRSLDEVPEDVAVIRRLVHQYLDARAPLFDRRIREGRVVDGHGDLLAEDIFCLPDGPRVLDCLEFDDRLRYVDGLDDAAFLAMDLERLGSLQAAGHFLSRYTEYSADPAPSSLYHHFVAYRAFVRAKVALIQARQGLAGAARDARTLIGMTLRHLRASTVRLILVGGLPASGKSTLSGALADRLGITLLSSDRLRKELAGLPQEAPAPAAFGEGLYTPEWTSRTYGTLVEHAATLLSSGESVVLDATWTAQEHRAAAERMAERCQAELTAVRCVVPTDLTARRLRGRAQEGLGTSDASFEIASAIAERQDPWPEAMVVDTSKSLDHAVAQALAAVHPSAAERAVPFRRSYLRSD